MHGVLGVTIFDCTEQCEYVLHAGLHDCLTWIPCCLPESDPMLLPGYGTPLDRDPPWTGSIEWEVRGDKGGGAAPYVKTEWQGVSGETSPYVKT